MNHKLRILGIVGLFTAAIGHAQLPDEPPPRFERPPGFRRGGPPPGPMQEETKLVKQFDKEGDKRLNVAERKAAREFLAKERAEGRGARRRGPRGRDQEPQEPVQAGPKLSTADVKKYPDAGLYDPLIVRTLFLEFENADWEAELGDFYRTDVEVPCKLTVDGKAYRDIGVHFRGASSFFTVSPTRKRSLNLSLDFVHDDQRLGGYRTLNLLNSHTDPTFLRTVLYYHIARAYIPAPKANYVRVVINGESWGIYVNGQQFNKDFTRDWFNSTQGLRWKVPGSPRGDGGLSYLGQDSAKYKERYEIRSKDEVKSWHELIQLCQVLNETPADKLEAALNPLLDIDGTLKFLALENALINSDGYWTRASDYNLYRDEKGRFHLIPHDVNETFRAPDGPGRGDSGPSQGVELDPFAGADDPNKPLLNKLLAVPKVRQRYLRYVRQIAQEWLDWKKLGPAAAEFQRLIAADVRTDTHNLYPFDSFQRGVTEDSEEQGFRGPRQRMSLKSFVEKRRAFLLAYRDTAQ